jgi:hypothetical protein
MEWAASRTSRFVGFHDTYSAGAPPEVGTDSAVVGVLSWTDEEAPLQRFAVLAERPEAFAVTAIGFRVAGRRVTDSLLTLFPKDSTADLGVEIDLIAPQSGVRATVRVPVQGQALDPTRARLSPGFRLRPGS